MKDAWVENGVIRDIAPGNPAQYYTPDIAAHYTTQVPDNANNGDSWDGTTLIRPPTPVLVPPIAATPIPPTVSVTTFLLLFTSPERVAIRAAVASDPIIADWWAVLNDPRTTTVDLNLTGVQQALDYLTSKTLLAAGRKAEILTGTLK